MVKKVNNTVETSSCRICNDNRDDDRLISPCKCKGTMKYVHKTCLTNWMEKRKTCEVCHIEFTIKLSLWERLMNYRDKYLKFRYPYMELDIILTSGTFIGFYWLLDVMSEPIIRDVPYGDLLVIGGTILPHMLFIKFLMDCGFDHIRNRIRRTPASQSPLWLLEQCFTYREIPSLLALATLVQLGPGYAYLIGKKILSNTNIINYLGQSGVLCKGLFIGCVLSGFLRAKNA